MQLIDHASAARFIGAMAPDWTWLLRQIESDDGYVRFPPRFSRIITNLNIGNYPDLYANELFIGWIMLLAFLSPEEIKALDTELALLSPEDRGKLIFELANDFEAEVEAIDIPKTPAQEKRLLEAFNALSKEEQGEARKCAQYFFMAFLAGFYQSLSIMVHGEKLTSLVAQAKAGNDKAFAKAVQIDKNVLNGIPYFKQRSFEANLEGNRKFTEDVAAHQLRAPYKGKIRHKSLYLAFAFLESVGLLDTMKHREILDLVNDAGLDAHANRIDDVKNLSKRLGEYRAFQHRGLNLSTP